MSNKITLSTKTISAIFLAIVLITGTITAIVPSFIIGVNAQSEPYYEMDDRYNDYQQDYGMDNSYDKKDRDYYGMDNNYDKSYGYEQKYSSYGEKDDRKDKSKKDDNSKSVSINKFNCINTNLNINGNNAGNVSIGNKGQTDLVANSSNGGYEGYYDGYGNNKQGKEGFDCIINNNNNNTNIVTSGNGNQTIQPTPPIPPVDECLLCFEETNQTVRDAVITALEAPGPLVIVPGVYEVPADVTTIEGLCEWLTENAPLELTRTQIANLVIQFLRANPTLDRGEVEELVECLIDAELIDVVTCDDCFARLDANIQTTINTLLAEPGPIPLPAGIGGEIPATVTNIAELCLFLNANPISITDTQISLLVQAFVALIGQGSDNIATALVNCLIEVGVITTSTPELTTSSTNTGSLISSFSSPDNLAHETGDLTALEKIEKLKRQWLELLP